MRSIFGRSRVTQRVFALAALRSSAPPAAFQPSSIPPSRTCAAMPCSPSAIATPWLSSCPCTQYATTRLARGSSPAHSVTRSGSRQRAPAIMSVAARNASSRRTSMINGGRPPRMADRTSFVDTKPADGAASMASPDEVSEAELGRGRLGPVWSRAGSLHFPARPPYWNGASAMSSLMPAHRDQIRPDLADRAHARELHGAHQLVAQDLERARRARLARRAGAVERRAAEHHAFGAERDRLDDVHPAAHAAVHQHAYPALDRANDGWKRLERRDGAVELPPAVVGQDHRVNAHRREPLGLVGAKDSLHQHFPGPAVAYFLQAVPIEVGVPEASDRGSDLRNVGRLGREARDVFQSRHPVPEGREPPAGPRSEIEDVLPAEAERDHVVVAEVPLALAAYRHVHRDHERVVAELPRALDQLQGDLALVEHVGLERQAPARLARDALDRGRRHGRERIRNAGRRGRARNADVGERPAEADAARGPDGDRELGARAENIRGGVDLRHASEHLGGDTHALESRAVFAKGGLVLGGAVEEVEDRARQAFFREPAQALYVPGAQDASGGAPRSRAGGRNRGLSLGCRAGKPARRAHSAFTHEVLMTRAQRS